MRVFLIRHGLAADGADDDARPLTPKGRARVDDVVGLLARLDVRFDLLLHSPKRRAVETAERCTALLDGSTEVTSLLAAPPSRALLALLAQRRVGAVALVGHEPWLSGLLSWLVSGSTRAGGFELKKGAVACLRGEPSPGAMTLEWLLPARVARR